MFHPTGKEVGDKLSQLHQTHGGITFRTGYNTPAPGIFCDACQSVLVYDPSRADPLNSILKLGCLKCCIWIPVSYIDQQHKILNILISATDTQDTKGADAAGRLVEKTEGGKRFYSIQS